MRWYEVYKILKEYQENIECTLIKEVLMFMEEYDLSGNNQFSSVDILAMNNFLNVRKMMNETLFGKVAEKFSLVAGGVSSESTALTQLRNYGRYTVIKNQKDYFEIVLGYWLQSKSMTDFPRVGIQIAVGPKSENYDKIIQIIKEIEHKYPDKWTTFAFDDSKVWSGIKQEIPLNKFMGEEDQIKAVENYFLLILDDVENIKKEHPDLPWNILSSE